MFLDNVLSATNTLYSNNAIVATLLVFLMVATITDIRALKIPDKLNGLFFILRLALIPIIGISFNNVLGAIIGFFLLLIPAMIRMHKMGGDIKCMTVVGFYLGAYITPVFIAITCIYGLVYSLFKLFITKKKGNMPFAPFFLLTHITLWLITNLF